MSKIMLEMLCEATDDDPEFLARVLHFDQVGEKPPPVPNGCGPLSAFGGVMVQ